MTYDQIDEWLMKDFDPDSLRVLEDREEEPNFEPTLKRAHDLLASGATHADASLVRDLLAVIMHLDNTLHAYYWNMSDNGDLPEGA
jgi:hypothetical protein